MGLTSREPILDVRRIVDGMHHGSLRCKIGDVVYYVIHFHPSDCERRIAEANILLADAATLPKESATVLIGDFNGFSPADRAQYDADERLVPFFDQRDEKLGERNLFQHAIDYRGINVLLAAGFVDLVAKHRTSFVGTFPTRLRADVDKRHRPSLGLRYDPELQDEDRGRSHCSRRIDVDVVGPLSRDRRFRPMTRSPNEGLTRRGRSGFAHLRCLLECFGNILDPRWFGEDKVRR